MQTASAMGSSSTGCCNRKEYNYVILSSTFPPFSLRFYFYSHWCKQVRKIQCMFLSIREPKAFQKMTRSTNFRDKIYIQQHWICQFDPDIWFSLVPESHYSILFFFKYSPYTEEISFFQNEESNNYSDPVMVKVHSMFQRYERDFTMHNQAGYNRIAMAGGDLWRFSNPTLCRGSVP